MAWTVAVICGAAGVGKSRLAAALALRHGVPVAASDDVATALLALTTGATLPALHRWHDDPTTHAWPAGRRSARRSPPGCGPSPPSAPSRSSPPARTRTWSTAWSAP